MMMNMKKCSWCSVDSGLLVLRIGVAGIFLVSGWMKVTDLPATVGFFGAMGFAPFWAYLVTAVELAGGVAVLLGFLTCVASAFLAVIMIVATYELRTQPTMIFTPVSLLFSTVALVLANGGKYSLRT